MKEEESKELHRRVEKSLTRYVRLKIFGHLRKIIESILTLKISSYVTNIKNIKKKHMKVGIDTKEIWGEEVFVNYASQIQVLQPRTRIQREDC